MYEVDFLITMRGGAQNTITVGIKEKSEIGEFYRQLIRREGWVEFANFIARVDEIAAVNVVSIKRLMDEIEI